MKKFLLVVSCFALSAGLASAQTCKSVAILQAQAALGSTREGKAADEDLNSRLGAKANALKARQDELQKLQEKISRGGNTLSDSAKAELQKEFDTKNKSFTRDRQAFEDEANAETNKVLASLTDKMKKVIDTYSKLHNYCLVLNVSDPNTPVVYFSDEVDITPAIIEAYDKMEATTPAASKPAATTPALGAKAPAAPPAKSPAAGTKTVPPPGK